MTRRDPFVFGNHDLTGLVSDVKAGHFATQTLGHKLHLRATVHQPEVVVDKEVGQDRLMIKANSLEQYGHRHLAPTIYPEVQNILGVELEIQPGAAVGDDACREQQFA